MTDAPERSTPACQIVLDTHPSELRFKTGGPVAFTRVTLELRNTGDTPAEDLGLHLSIREGNTVLFDGGDQLLAERGVASLPPGASEAWDLYDLLSEKASGFSSKVHLFGIKAVVNWQFVVEATLRYRPAGGEEHTVGPETFGFRWAQPDGQADRVVAERD